MKPNLYPPFIMDVEIKSPYITCAPIIKGQNTSFFWERTKYLSTKSGSRKLWSICNLIKYHKYIDIQRAL